MTKVIAGLIRHGIYEQPDQVPSAHLPHPLTEEGRAQARSAAADIAAECARQGWKLHPEIDASSLLRAWETASVIAEVLIRETRTELVISEFDELAERGLGAAANLSVGQIEAIVARDPRREDLPEGWKRRSDFRLPFIGAESMVEAGVRTARHVEHRTAALVAKAKEPTVKLFVGHGAAFRHAAIELGALTLEQVPRLSMYHCRPVYLERKDRGRWVHVGGDWKERQSERGPFD